MGALALCALVREVTALPDALPLTLPPIAALPLPSRLPVGSIENELQPVEESETSAVWVGIVEAVVATLSDCCPVGDAVGEAQAVAMLEALPRSSLRVPSKDGEARAEGD